MQFTYARTRVTELERVEVRQRGLQVRGDLLEQAPLGLAPTSRATTSPSLNSNSVGMLITENLVAVATLTSTSSLPMVNLSDCSTANSSRMGAIILHGPHHSAQKSTRIGLSDAPTTSSKVASVRVVMLLAHSLTSKGGAVVAPENHFSGGGALVTLRFEPALGVDCGDAAGARLT
jgi:hypothetical protein